MGKESFMLNHSCWLVWLASLWIVYLPKYMAITETTKSQRRQICDGYTSQERLEWQLTTRSRSECVGKCLKDARCVSVFYESLTSICQGHSVTLGVLHSSTTAGTGSTYYVLDRGQQYIGDSCGTSSDCITINADCRQGQCLCIVGYSFTPDTRTCNIGCADYGEYFTITQDAYIAGYNVEEIVPISLDVCLDTCASRTSYTCRAVEYMSNTQKCNLQALSRFDVPSSEWVWDTQQKFNVFWYERECH